MSDAQVHSGATIGFKTGLQSAVNTMLSNKSGAEHGTFYLATDTHRLYIGNQDTSLSPVNEGIVTVETIADLPVAGDAHPGEFYYVTGTQAKPLNILCVHNGTEWVQINSDTDTSINTFTSSVDANGQVTFTLREKNKSGTDIGRNIPASFTVTGSNGITITGNGTALNVAGNTYTLGHQITGNGEDGVATINLTSANPSSAASSSLDIVAGDNVEIKAGASGGIEISASDTINTVTEMTAGENTGGSGFKIGITQSVGGSKSATFSPTITYGETGSKTSASFNGGIADLDIYTKAQIDTKMQALDAMHYRGTIGKSTQDPQDSTKTIGVDGSAAITDTITTANFNLEPNSARLKVGDTFKLSSFVTINGEGYSANSIIIARGQEDNGYIQQNSLQFDVIQATADTDTRYTFRSNTDATNGNAVGVVLHASTGGDVSSFRIKPGTAITAAQDPTASASDQVVTVAHANITCTQNKDNPADIPDIPQNTYNYNFDTNQVTTDTTVPVVTSVTVDAQGHTTAVETKNIILKDTNARLNNLTTTAANHQEQGVDVPNKIDITTTAAIINGNGGAYNKADTVSISSDNLTITKLADANEIKINLVWGSFGPQQ